MLPKQKRATHQHHSSCKPSIGARVGPHRCSILQCGKSKFMIPVEIICCQCTTVPEGVTNLRGASDQSQRNDWSISPVSAVFLNGILTVCCRFFRNVLLKDPEAGTLEAEIFHPSSDKRCVMCGNQFYSIGNRAKYCPACKAEVQRKQKAEYARRKRAGVEK